MGEIADALRRADRPEPTRKNSPREILVAEKLADKTDNKVDKANLDATPTEDRSIQRPAPPESTPARPRQILNRDDLDDPRPARIAITDPYGNATQQFRRLAFRTREVADTRQTRSIVVTSAQVGDGKTTTICNLAVQLARLDQSRRVILVDLDLRRPSVAAALGLEFDISVDAVLRGEQRLDDAILETDVEGLSILALNAPTADPESLLAHPNLHSMIRELESRFDIVLIDTPPVLAVTDAQIILRHASAGIFVARAGSTTVKSIRRALDLLPTRKFLGSFLNSSPKALGMMSSYGYYGETPTKETEAPDD